MKKEEQCPTCGHNHSGGLGINLCMCRDCLLVWNHKPELLTKEHKQRRKELLKSMKEAENGKN